MSKNRRAGCLLVNNKNQFLVVHQIESGKWGLPKGRIESHETPVDAALRELREETGWIARPLAIRRCISLKQHKFYVIYTRDCAFRYAAPNGFVVDGIEIDQARWITFEEYRTMPKTKFMEEFAKKAERLGVIDTTEERHKIPSAGSSRRLIIPSLQKIRRRRLRPREIRGSSDGCRRLECLSHQNSPSNKRRRIFDACWRSSPCGAGREHSAGRDNSVEAQHPKYIAWCDLRARFRTQHQQPI